METPLNPGDSLPHVNHTRLSVLVAALVSLAVAVAAGPSVCAPLGPPVGTVVNVATESELQSAFSNLASSSTIVIADGLYDLTQTLRIRGGVTDVTVRSASGDRDAVVLRGRGMSNSNYGNVPHGFLIGDATDIMIADLTVREAYFHNVQIQGEQGALRVTLRNLRLVDAGEQQVKGSSGGPPGPYADGGIVECSLIEYTDRARSDYTNGVDVLAGADWIIRDNVFRNIRAPIGQLAGPAVLMWRNCLDTLVERNLFINCDRGVALGLAAPDPSNARDGDTTYDHQGGLVRNNVFYREAGLDGDVAFAVNYCRDYQMHHNTAILNGTFQWAMEYRFDVSVGEIFNNLTDGAILQRNNAVGTLAGNITTAGLAWFVDPSGFDLHLLSSATTAIDQGVSVATVTDDCDSESRPSGAAPDVGADEYRQGCALPAAPLVNLLAARVGGDVRLSWSAAAVDSYNVWHVAGKQEIDQARMTSSPPAVPVVACATPNPTTIPSCTDLGAVSRGVAGLFYQVRAFCGGSAEGP